VSALATGALWLAPEWTMLPLAAQRCRVRNPLNGAVAELSREQYAVLTACEGCATLEQHHAGILRKLEVRFEHRTTVMQWLREFAAQRLLVPLAELAGRLGTELPSPAPFAGVFVRTCDRPALLARALASAAALEARRGSRHGYTVLDDSRDSIHRTTNREAARRSGLDVHYVDLAEPTSLERALRAALPGAPAALDWLLGAAGFGEATYGRPVNVALLLTAGRRVLLLDDDALAEPQRAPHFEAGVSVSSEGDDLTAFADWAALDAACPAMDVDPFEAHLDLLGQPVWKRLGDASAIQVTSADAARFGPDARVLVTQNGALGDPGSSLFPYHLLALPERSLVRNPDARLAFEQRIDWRGQDRLRLAPNRPLTFTTLAGIDNSVLLPPTVRAHRNEDLLLGELAQIIHPGAWYADLPWGLPHRREPEKQWLGPNDTFAQEPVHFLLDYLSERASAIASDAPEQRLGAIAAFLLDLSGASDARLAELLEAHVADTSTRVLFAIASRLDDARTPPAWKDELRPWQRSPALAVDVASIRRRIVAPASLRTLARNYGEALSAWPEVWRVAAQLQA
jgi:hypothetical protein